MANENYEAVGSPDGSIIGKSTGKLGFFGTAPTVKATITPTVGSAVATTGATNSSPYGYAEAQANAIVANVNALRVDLLALVAELEAKGLIG